MTGLSGAIVARWAGQAVSSQFSSRNLFLTSASRSATPYAVLTMVAEPVRDQTTDYQIVDGVYQIACFADTPEQAYDLARQARNAFHRATLTTSDDQPMHCYGGEIRMGPDEGLGGLGRDVWMAFVEIEILAQR